MSKPGTDFTTFLFNDKQYVGEVRIIPKSEDQYLEQTFSKKEMKITFFSSPSERCQPLAVLHTICPSGVWFTMDVPQQLLTDTSDLNYLHTCCSKEAKTAVVPMDGLELHLVAMNSKSEEQKPFFWAFLVAEGLYSACLTMLNLRCLALVFDLDETLIVANTRRSFEIRIEALKEKLASPYTDPDHKDGFAAELKRYQEDEAILRQYTESDQVYDNGRLFKAQVEKVTANLASNNVLERPIIRLQERSMILTRINPAVRDTSVLVRLRPAWEELRSYVIAKGRKRFEVFICTMSEKDYALEMWRLLDPEARLIPTKELQERVVCVKSGSKKSLVNVFSKGRCHPKLAMVVDDRLKVWDDKDQPHVYVVPAFAPYYAPQAETSNSLPTLCVARNIACTVRGGFYKDFDEVLSQKMAEVQFDTEFTALPRPPDVSNYLVNQEDSNLLALENGNKIFPDGMRDAEVEARLKLQVPIPNKAPPAILIGKESFETSNILSMQPDHKAPLNMLPGLSFPLQTPKLVQDNDTLPRISFLQSPISINLPEVHVETPMVEEGEVPESELDPDTRRRLLILQHGQDTEHHSQNSPDAVLSMSRGLQIKLPPMAPPREWPVEEEQMSPGQLPRCSPGIVLEPESPSFEMQQVGSSAFEHVMETSYVTGRCLPEETFFGGKKRQDEAPVDYSSHSEDDDLLGRNGSNLKEQHESDAVAALDYIARRVNLAVDYKSLLKPTAELLFSVEAYFDGEKVGSGTGRTTKEARVRAAEDGIRYLANKHIDPPPGEFRGQNMSPPGFSRGLRWNVKNISYANGRGHDENMPTLGASDKIACRPQDKIMQFNAAAALKDLCTIEQLNVIFQNKSVQTARMMTYICEVEVAGQLMGKGKGITWEAAEQEAAEDALRCLRLGPHSLIAQKRPLPHRSPSLQASKRLRAGELLRGPGQGSRLSPRKSGPQFLHLK